LQNQKLLGHLQQEDLKLECSFITDITIPDGTSMAPFNPFTKIWRLRNSGCTIWPFGTQVIWVGGDQFAVQNPVKLGVSTTYYLVVCANIWLSVLRACDNI
jgi:next to BRCA1 gene 1 protein